MVTNDSPHPSGSRSRKLQEARPGPQGGAATSGTPATGTGPSAVTAVCPGPLPTQQRQSILAAARLPAVTPPHRDTQEPETTQNQPEDDKGLRTSDTTGLGQGPSLRGSRAMQRAWTVAWAWICLQRTRAVTSSPGSRGSSGELFLCWTRCRAGLAHNHTCVSWAARASLS